MKSYKKQFIDGIINVEGGYANDPDDSGGETNWGVTKRVARKSGYRGSMRFMSREVAFAIYSDLYWDELNLDEVEKLAPTIAQELADTGVNQGTDRAAEFLQRSLNVLNDRERLYNDIIVDGDIGPATLRAFRAYLKKRKRKGETVLFNMLNCLQGAFYVTLAERREKDERFVYGWFDHRIKLT